MTNNRILVTIATVMLVLTLPTTALAAQNVLERMFDAVTNELKKGSTSKQDSRDPNTDDSRVYEALQVAASAGRTNSRVHWKNPVTGSSGAIRIEMFGKNAFGVQCADFESEVQTNSLQTVTKGQACKQILGGWNVTRQNLVSSRSLEPERSERTAPRESSREPVQLALVQEAQRLLTTLGYDAGVADGIDGPRTQRAVQAYQRHSGFPMDGRISESLITSMKDSVETGTGTQQTPDLASAASDNTQDDGGPPAGQSKLSEKKRPTILTIDGVDKLMVAELHSVTGLWADGRTQSYLQNEPDGINDEGWPFVANWHYFPWSGNPDDTDDFIPGLKTTIDLIHRLSDAADRSFVIVAHSWGGVLAYRALRELNEADELPAGSVAVLITMGTPLMAQNQVFRLKSRSFDRWGGPGLIRPLVSTWRNYWIDKDNISGSISALGETDVELPFTHSDGDPHSAYYKYSLFRNSIALDLRNAMQTRDPESTLATASRDRAIEPASPTARTEPSSSGSAAVPAVPSITQRGAMSPGDLCISDICIGDTIESALDAMDRIQWAITAADFESGFNNPASKARNRQREAKAPSLQRYLIGVSLEGAKTIARRASVHFKAGAPSRIQKSTVYDRELLLALGEVEVFCIPVFLHVGGEGTPVVVELSAKPAPTKIQPLRIISIYKSYGFLSEQQRSDWEEKVRYRFSTAVQVKRIFRSEVRKPVMFSSQMDAKTGRGTGALQLKDVSFSENESTLLLKEHHSCPRHEENVEL